MNIFAKLIDYIIEDRSYKRAHELDLKRMELEQERSLIETQTTCQSCETLKLEIARLHEQNNRLIELSMNKPVVKEEPAQASTAGIPARMPSRHVPWSVRQQMLEREDLAKAQILKRNHFENDNSPAAQPTTVASTEQPMTTSQIETELGIDVAAGDNNGN